MAPLSSRGWHQFLSCHLFQMSILHQLFIMFALLLKLYFTLFTAFRIQPDFIQRRRLVDKVIISIIFISSIDLTLVPYRFSQIESTKALAAPELKTVLNKSSKRT